MLCIQLIYELEIHESRTLNYGWLQVGPEKLYFFSIHFITATYLTPPDRCNLSAKLSKRTVSPIDEPPFGDQWQPSTSEGGDTKYWKI